jgi:hypothetical protein
MCLRGGCAAAAPLPFGPSSVLPDSGSVLSHSFGLGALLHLAGGVESRGDRSAVQLGQVGADIAGQLVALAGREPVSDCTTKWA